MDRNVSSDKFFDQFVVPDFVFVVGSFNSKEDRVALGLEPEDCILGSPIFSESMLEWGKLSRMRSICWSGIFVRMR